jgi:subtilisin family serine protease
VRPTGSRCLALLAVTCLWLLPAAAPGEPLVARVPPAKPARTWLAPGDDPLRIVLKFHERSALRAVPVAERIVRGAGIPVQRVRRMFPLPQARLDAQRAQGEARSGRALADLNLYFEIELAPGADAGRACDALNALPFVELASPARRPAPPPADLAPVTPEFRDRQGYRAAAPAGVGTDAVLTIPGATGAGVRIVDVEYQWVLDHEDLELDASANIETATLLDPFPNDFGNHGTAVLGILGGRTNRYGVLGLAPAATLLVAPANTEEFLYNPGRAILLAADALAPGDVILVEQQTWVCTEQRFGPIEWVPFWFDAIASATSRGIVVIEAAGNGAIDLDGAGCSGWFDRNVRDSGAIVVGAGSRDYRWPLFLTSYGSRLDVQGWGEGVATTGYGDLFDPGDLRQRYTRVFNGTSSASAIVAGVAASVQGAVLAHGLPPLEPAELRDLLVSTGTPQGGTVHVGPLPDLLAALDALEIEPPPPPPACGLGGLELLPLLLALGVLRRRV